MITFDSWLRNNCKVGRRGNVILGGGSYPEITH